MKILTGIQKQNSHIALGFSEGERHERAKCCDSSCSNQTGIQKRMRNVGRGAAALGMDTHTHSAQE